MSRMKGLVIRTPPTIDITHILKWSILPSAEITTTLRRLDTYFMTSVSPRRKDAAALKISTSPEMVRRY